MYEAFKSFQIQTSHGWISYYHDPFSLNQVTICLTGRDKKKDFAPNHAAYYPFGVDVFLSPRKIDHIARFVELPVISHSGKLPSILVVNVQVSLLYICSF